MRTHWLLAALPLTAVACAGSHAEQVRDARMERIEDRADAHEDQIEKNADVRQDLIENEYDSREKIAQAQGGPAEDANEELLELSKQREEYAASARTQLNGLAVRITEAERKLGVLGARAPRGLHSELDAATQEYKLLDEELDSLDDASSTSWEADKSKLDQRLSGLQDRVSQLQDHIDDVAS